MSEPQKAEQALLDIADKFEEFLRSYRVALFDTTFKEESAKWYTPREMSLRMLKAVAVAAPSDEARALAAVIHGAINCLGFKGTLKLILNLRRKHGGKQTKGNLSGVRQGSRNNPQ